MKSVFASFVVLFAISTGCGDDSAADTGMPDTGAADTGNPLESTPCTFPATVMTSSDRIFVCHADSAAECEITTALPTSTQTCTDFGAPDWTFLFDVMEGVATLDATGWMMTGFNAGTIMAGASVLADIPDATEVSMIISKDGVDYDLTFELDVAATTVTISEFSMR